MVEKTVGSEEPVSVAQFWSKFPEFMERIATKKYELQIQPGGVSLTRADGKVASLIATREASGNVVMVWRSFSGIEDSYRSGGASVGNVIYNLES
jgi:hypothetical protein